MLRLPKRLSSSVPPPTELLPRENTREALEALPLLKASTLPTIRIEEKGKKRNFKAIKDLS